MTQVSIFTALFYLSVFQFDLLYCYTILPEPNISPECELDGICDKVENYPKNLVKDLIAKLKAQNTIFNYDEAPLPRISTRFNAFEEEPISLCETRPRYIPVEAARNMSGHWKYIINDPQEPVQVIKTEICKKRSGPCTENIRFLPGYEGACIQKMVYREMFYVNETNQIGTTYFEIPVCCSCSLFRKDDYK